jgi:hypothetical protein
MAELREPVNDNPREHYTPLTLTVAQIETLVRELDAGAPIDSLADMLRVSRRTVYRYRGARIVQITLGDWRARYVVRLGNQPLRLGQWRRARR